jgi:hypothetical protein
MGYFSFSLPLEMGMEEVFLRGGKGLFKRLFLECHGQGGSIVCKGRGVWVFSFVFYFLPRYSHNTGHWLVLMKHSVLNRVIDNLPTCSSFLNKLIIIDPLGLEFSNFNNLIRGLEYHPSRISWCTIWMTPYKKL